MSEISAINAATAGMAMARRRLDSAAAVVAVATLPNAEGLAQAGVPAVDGDRAGALIEQLVAVGMFGLNATAARSADDLMAEAVHVADGLVAE